MYPYCDLKINDVYIISEAAKLVVVVIDHLVSDSCCVGILVAEVDGA